MTDPCRAALAEERAKFEAFFRESRTGKGVKHVPNLVRLHDDTYYDASTQRHWWTWQQAWAAARSALAQEAVPPEAEFELHCDGELSASASGPRERAWREIQHYAAQYAQDGPIEIFKVTRTLVAQPQDPKDQT